MRHIQDAERKQSHTVHGRGNIDLCVFLLSVSLVSGLTSSSTCAPAAAPLGAAAAVPGAPGRKMHAAAGSRHTEAGWCRTWASPLGLALWSGRRASRPSAEPGWRRGGPAAAAAPRCARRGLASSCSGGSGTKSSPGSGWGGPTRPGAPSQGRTGSAAAGSGAPARRSAPWRRARAASCRDSSAQRRTAPAALRPDTHPWTARGI